MQSGKFKAFLFQAKFLKMVIIILVIWMCSEAANNVNKPREAWTTLEDDFLRTLVPKQGKVDWSLVQKAFNSNFPILSKTSKQLRERFTNHARFELQDQKQSDWTEAQIRELFRLYLENGPKWTELSRFFQGKSENSLKNKFYGSIRKLLRRINTLEKKLLPAYTKPLKYDAFVRVLDVQESNVVIPDNFLESAHSLRRQIVEFCQEGFSDSQPDDFVLFLRSLHHFNLKTRCYRLKKNFKKKSQTESSQRGESLVESEEKYERRNTKDQIRSILTNNDPSKNIPSICSNVEIFQQPPNISNEKKDTQSGLQMIQYAREDDRGVTRMREQQMLEYEACQRLGIQFEWPDQILKEFF